MSLRNWGNRQSLSRLPIDIWAKKYIYTVDIWGTTLVDIRGTKFQLTLKYMWTIDRSSQPLPVLIGKVLHEINVLVSQLLLFSQDGHKGNENK